ncbi:MAG: SLBB domain-containing protein [Cytophagales bacterium]|nr:SLBB domain-containing protein [Cytophagales bacterium]
MNQRLLDPFFSLKLQEIITETHFIMIRRANYLLLFILTLFSLSILGQQLPIDVNNITDAQIEQFLKEVENRGLTEAEIEAAARLQGYSSSEIELINSKIDEYRNGPKVDSIKSSNNIPRKQLGSLSKKSPSQRELEVGKNNLKVFGYNLFKNKELNFEPSLRLPTPKDYILGADDELKVDISGYAYQHYDLTVSPEGTIKIESLSPIYVNGYTIEEAKRIIIDKLKFLFGGLRNGSLTAEVTLGNVRSIQVTIAGEVENPGTYSLSSLSKVYNALYSCGGPSENGSFRYIKLIRDNREIAEIDLYSFLTKGITKGNIHLKDQDFIFIPIAEKKVELLGEVKRPAIFELRKEETLKDLLIYASGFTDKAYTDLITITRSTNKEKTLLSVDGNNPDLFTLKNGDEIVVNSILPRFENRVEVIGSVFRPGQYALSSDLSTILDLINIADGPTEEAFLDRILLFRENDKKEESIIPLNLRNIIDRKDENISLKRNDKIVVKSYSELREERFVEIAGAVNMSGVFPYYEDMTVEDLIILAGGFSEGATLKRIEIARRLFNDEKSDNTVEVLTYTTNKNLSGGFNNILSPFDKVFIRELPNYEEQKLVTITGEVNYPGVYTIKKREERILDLILRSGGLREEAYLQGGRFYRDGKLLAMNLQKAINEAGNFGNLVLQEGDSLHLPKIPEVVKLSGQVLNPTTIAFQPNLNFDDYIAQAGGFTDSAFVRKIYVRYSNGLTDRTRSFMGIKNYPDVERGMEVIVPTRRKTRWTGAERISVSAGIISLSAVLLTLIRLI